MWQSDNEISSFIILSFPVYRSIDCCIRAFYCSKKCCSSSPFSTTLQFLLLPFSQMCTFHFGEHVELPWNEIWRKWRILEHSSTSVIENLIHRHCGLACVIEGRIHVFPSQIRSFLHSLNHDNILHIERNDWYCCFQF